MKNLLYLLLLSLYFLIGCNYRSTTILLNKNFRGNIFIISSEKSRLKLSNTNNSINIPANGIVYVKQDDLNKIWSNNIFFAYDNSDNKSIYSLTNEINLSKDSVVIFGDSYWNFNIPECNLNDSKVIRFSIDSFKNIYRYEIQYEKELPKMLCDTSYKLKLNY